MKHRQDYWHVINEYFANDGNLLVMADETSKNDITAGRYECAVGGHRAAQVVMVCVNSLTAAMSKQGYITIKVVPSSLNLFDSFDFVAESVVCHFSFQHLFFWHFHCSFHK